MKFRTFKQEKLWRDKRVELIQQMGSKILWTHLDDAAFTEELKKKLLEETHEACNAKTKETLIEEFADIVEVIETWCNLHHFTLTDVMNAKHKKLQEHGGFQGRKFVTTAEHPEGSYAESYCLADPEKYPEIKECELDN